MDTPPIQDRDKALGLLMGREELLRRLESVFAEDIQDTMTDLRQALDESKLDVAVRLAHSIKGQAATIGAFAASEAAKAVELWARSGVPGEYGHLADNLDIALREILAAISARAQT